MSKYQETLAFLYRSLPALEKKGWGAYKPGLERTFQLAELAGNPQNYFKSIHVGGTNGKGSVSSMVASVLMEGGYKVGLFTSPHLKDFRERITVNGIQITEEEVIDFVNAFREQAGSLQPSFFEYTFVMALEHFKRKEVDFAVIEVGLGGRLDCTNIIQPKLSIITTIGLDHQQFLGNTLAEIAAEKAGIIKPDTPILIGQIDKVPRNVIQEKAQQVNAPLFYSDIELELEESEEPSYQIENRKTAVKAIMVLKANGLVLRENAINDGLLNYKRNSSLRGRMEWLSKSPRVLVDVAHNLDGIQALLKSIHQIAINELRIVWGMSSDKNISEILKLLPENASYYWCAAENPRSLRSEELKEYGEKLGLKGDAHFSVQSAYKLALEEYCEGDLIVVTGSVFVVAEVL